MSGYRQGVKRRCNGDRFQCKYRLEIAWTYFEVRVSSLDLEITTFTCLLCLVGDRMAVNQQEGTFTITSVSVQGRCQVCEVAQFSFEKVIRERESKNAGA